MRAAGPAVAPPRPTHAAGRRPTLRVRLIALVLATAAVSLLAVDVALMLTVRGQLVSDQDSTLTSAIQTINGKLANGAVSIDQIGRVGSNPLGGGDVGWSVVYPTGMAQVVSAPGRHPSASPLVGDSPDTSQPTTVPDATLGSSVTYRILGLEVGIGPGTGYVVAWLPTSEVTQTVNRVMLLEALITVSLLLLLGGVASVIIRRELRPLESMAQAADEIARGDLDKRVEADDEGTEVGRLGTAFNGMLDGIGALVEERSRGEERMRQFLADASHELRTPVAAVQGYADLYRAGALTDPPAVDRAMERMGFEARRMGALVDDLLTLIKADSPQRGARETVDLGELLTGVMDDAAVIDRTRTWRLAGVSTGITVTGDRLRLHQLFANLLSNVRTHTPAGTTATLAVLPGPTEVAVVVSDNGPGVSDEDLPKLFDRFYRAEKSRSREWGGTGLGLSIVAAIAATHGGQVLASHGVTGGLTITVVLPLATGTAAVRPVPADEAPQAPPGADGGAARESSHESVI